MRKTYMFAISGVKNSGKTTMVTGILPCLVKKGYRVATIKHDGHDFEADIPGTDSWRHAQAGAYGTVVFSENKYMLVKQQSTVSEAELAQFFPEADIILLEGFKYSSYPKLEVVRAERTTQPVCKGSSLLAIASDVSLQITEKNVRYFPLDAYQEIADFIEEKYLKWKK